MISDDQSRRSYWLLKDVDKAIREYNMIQDGDRIAVAVSGGNDSLSLLQLLDHRLNSSKEKYSLAAIHVVGDSEGPKKPAHSPLLEWFDQKGYDTSIEKMIISTDEVLPMTCKRCSWNKRRTIFKAALKLGCNKVAFGHHADDFAETTLMNLIYSARVETMSPNSEYFGGTFRLIRPLCYTSKKDLIRFVRVCDFPHPPPKCNESKSSHRMKVGELIQQAETWCKDIRVNLLRTGLNGIQEIETINEKSS